MTRGVNMSNNSPSSYFKKSSLSPYGQLPSPQKVVVPRRKNTNNDASSSPHHHHHHPHRSPASNSNSNSNAPTASLSELQRELRNPHFDDDGKPHILGRPSEKDFVALSPEQRERLRHQVHARTLLPLSASPQLVRETHQPLKTHKNQRRAETDVSPGPGHYGGGVSFQSPSSSSSRRNHDDDEDDEKEKSRRRKQQLMVDGKPTPSVHDEMSRASASKFATDVSLRSAGPGAQQYDVLRGEAYVDKFKSAPAVSVGRANRRPQQLEPLASSSSSPPAAASAASAAAPPQLKSSIKGFSMMGRTLAMDLMSAPHAGSQLLACHSASDRTPAPGTYGLSVMPAEKNKKKKKKKMMMMTKVTPKKETEHEQKSPPKSDLKDEPELSFEL